MSSVPIAVSSLPRRTAGNHPRDGPVGPDLRRGSLTLSDQQGVHRNNPGGRDVTAIARWPSANPIISIVHRPNQAKGIKNAWTRRVAGLASRPPAEPFRRPGSVDRGAAATPPREAAGPPFEHAATAYLTASPTMSC